MRRRGESPTLAILFSFSGYAHQAVHSPLPRERIKVRAHFVSSRGLGQLSGGIFLRTLLDRTDIGDGPDLDHGAIFKARTLFGDVDRLVLIRDLKIAVTADCFFRFREGTVGNSAPLFARTDFPFLFQRVAAATPSLFLPSFEPG